jgi:PDZ domain
MNFRPSHFALLIPTFLICAVTFAQTAPAESPAKTAYLGVFAKSVKPAVRDQLNLPDGVGLTITFVDDNGPSAAAGLRVNDVLEKLDDQILINPQQLVVLIHSHHPGDSVTLSIYHDGQPQQISVKLGEKTPSTAAPLSVEGPDQALPPPANLQPEISADTMEFDDGKYSGVISADSASNRFMVVKDKIGTVVASGPIDTEEQWNKFPQDVRKHLGFVRSVVSAMPRPITDFSNLTPGRLHISTTQPASAHH